MGRGNSHSSGGGGGNAGGGAKKAFKAKSAKAIASMSSDERRQYLEDAPAGTVIKGLYSKRTGNEIHVEKQEGYVRGYGPFSSMAGPQKRTWWTVEGSTDNYIARTFRTAGDGTNQYYTVVKPRR